MVAEAAGQMMILAMHIIADRAAHGDVTRAWGNRQEPALWQNERDDLAQGDASFAMQPSAGRVKGDEAVQTATVEQGGPGFWQLSP